LNAQKGRIFKEVAVTYFEAMFKHFCGGTEGNNLNWDRCCYGWQSVLHTCSLFWTHSSLYDDDDLYNVRCVHSRDEGFEMIMAGGVHE